MERGAAVAARDRESPTDPSAPGWRCPRRWPRCAPPNPPSGPSARHGLQRPAAGVPGPVRRPARRRGLPPAGDDELEAVLDWCDGAGHVVVPFGGGSSVVWGVNPPAGAASVVTVDLTTMDRVLSSFASACIHKARFGRQTGGPRLSARVELDQARALGLREPPARRAGEHDERPAGPAVTQPRPSSSAAGAGAHWSSPTGCATRSGFPAGRYRPPRPRRRARPRRQWRRG